MSKVWTYVTVILGLAVVLTLGGINVPGVQSILKFVGWDIQNGTFDIISGLFWAAIVGSLGLAVLKGLTPGFLTSSNFYWVILAPFVTATMVTYIAIFAAIINYANGLSSWVAYIIIPIWGVFGVGFAFALYEWVFGIN